jgi:small subunit ribosomal protein S7
MYGSVVISKLINQLMYDGKKGTAQGVCYDAFEIIKAKTGREVTDVFVAALANIMPVLEVKARRVGSSTYQVPMEVRPVRRQTLGIRWLVDFSRKRSEHNMSERLAGEIMEAANNTGNAVKRREEMHRMAEANRAFAHYRW